MKPYSRLFLQAAISGAGLIFAVNYFPDFARQFLPVSIVQIVRDLSTPIFLMLFAVALPVAAYLFREVWLGKSDSETSAATERTVAASAETLTRDFQSRIDAAINRAVSRLSTQADDIIREHLGERVDNAVGSNLVGYLGAKLAAQTSNQSKLQELRREAADAFELMRSRALQYAEAANRQSAFFRWAAIILAFLGLFALGAVLMNQRFVLAAKPELLEQHIDWTTLIVANGPTYAFVVLSEFLAITMFRYQSKALEYMRYFSNEATNIDARRIGFFTTLNLLDKSALKKLVERLEATERNFLIDKNQRTLELANNENEDRMFDRFVRIASVWQKDEAAENGEKSQGDRAKRRASKKTVGER
jgi:hypothetical protein